MHWRRGEPVVVKNVLKKTCGLSWEPMVMMRAFRNAKKRLNEENQCVKAIDCLDWNEEPKPKKQSAPTAKIGSNKKPVSKPVSSSDESEFEYESSNDSDSSDEEVSQSVNLLALGYRGAKKSQLLLPRMVLLQPPRKPSEVMRLI
ncbi:unnamed protein product [Lactuca saligna]|uniref:Uncharacterized protein n=1 Tax=Lactuca saligna TaxID=75948 RepID=A0AA35V8N7_LACSI|nr:unnamed protein product [Lactuca saligna]